METTNHSLLPQFISRQKAAKMLDISVEEIDKLRRCGTLPYYKLNNRVIIRVDELLLFVAANKKLGGQR